MRIRGNQAITEQTRANQGAFVKVTACFGRKSASLKRVMEISEGVKQIAKLITTKKMLKVDLFAHRNIDCCLRYESFDENF